MKKIIFILGFIFIFNSCAKPQLNSWFFVCDEEITGLKADLIAVWPLDEITGTTVYDSHGSINMVNVGATVNQSGKINTSYLFSGGTDYLTRVTGGDELAPTNTYSLSSWIKIPSGLSDGIYCVMARGWIPIVDPNTNRGAIHSFEVELSFGVAYFRFHYTDTDHILTTVEFNSPYVTIANNWMHIVCTRANNLISIYSNGIFKNSTNGGNGNLLEADVLYNSIDIFGAYYDPIGDRSRNFSGYIEQIVVWGRAITQSDITELNNSGNGLAYIFW